MSIQVNRWRELGARLGLQVEALATVALDDTSATFTALLPQLGAKNGMIAGSDWDAISPFADALLRQDYGFSVVEIGDGEDESVKEMLRDWGWSAAEPKPAWW